MRRCGGHEAQTLTAGDWSSTIWSSGIHTAFTRLPLQRKTKKNKNVISKSHMHDGIIMIACPLTASPLVPPIPGSSVRSGFVPDANVAPQSHLGRSLSDRAPGSCGSGYEPRTAQKGWNVRMETFKRNNMQHLKLNCLDIDLKIVLTFFHKNIFIRWNSLHKFFFSFSYCFLPLSRLLESRKFLLAITIIYFHRNNAIK